MRRHLLASLLALLLLGPEAPPVSAADRCARSCRAEVAACVRTECASARGRARGTCIEERCRGPLGCPARIRTLAWVVTRCRTREGRLVGSQELRIHRGDCDPVTALRLDPPGEGVADPYGLCGRLAREREGHASPIGGLFQRLGVTPDGSGVVFEVSNAFVLNGRIPLTDEQQGFFYVRADGSGLRRLAPPSRDPTYRISRTRSGELSSDVLTYLPFSPSGRLIAYIDTDRDPAPDGTDATQIFTLDVATGRRTQVTRLPARLPSAFPSLRSVGEPVFQGEHTIRFKTFSSEHVSTEPFAVAPDLTTYTVGTDGTGLLRLAPRPTVSGSVSGGPVAPLFGVARPTGRIASLYLARESENENPKEPGESAREVFRIDGKDLVQLTAFGRHDTRGVGGGRTARPDGGDNLLARTSRVLLMASADPFGENPFHNCQLFSMDSLGAGLRQLTHFDEGAPSVWGCELDVPPGCSFDEVNQDPVTGWIVFYSNCDPFGRGFLGAQLFAMRPDGRRLRQLTHTAGARFGPGDEVELEIPGPVAYSMPIH